MAPTLIRKYLEHQEVHDSNFHLYKVKLILRPS